MNQLSVKKVLYKQIVLFIIDAVAKNIEVESR